MSHGGGAPETIGTVGTGTSRALGSFSAYLRYVASVYYVEAERNGPHRQGGDVLAGVPGLTMTRVLMRGWLQPRRESHARSWLLDTQSVRCRWPQLSIQRAGHYCSMPPTLAPNAVESLPSWISPAHPKQGEASAKALVGSLARLPKDRVAIPEELGAGETKCSHASRDAPGE